MAKMHPPAADDHAETAMLLQQAAQGNSTSWGTLLSRHRERLLRMISVRMDHRLKGRLDPSDIVQEACLEASMRLKEYLNSPDIPFFLWLRFLTGQRLMMMHRHHLGVHMRDAGKEVQLDFGGAPATTAAGLADCLMAHDPRPSEVAVQAEMKQLYQSALSSLDPLDREIIALRHYEQLSNVEAAKVLNLQESAASKRYIRAIDRLRQVLTQLPGAISEPAP